MYVKNTSNNEVIVVPDGVDAGTAATAQWGEGVSWAEATQQEYLDSLDPAPPTPQSIYEMSSGGGGKPDAAGWLVQPEVLDFDGTNTTFNLQNTPKFLTDVLVLQSSSFHYLQAADYNLAGNQLTINNPTLVSGDKVKVIYAI